MIDINKEHTSEITNYYFIEESSIQPEYYLITIDNNKNQKYIAHDNEIEDDDFLHSNWTYYQITKQIFDSLREMSEELRKELIKSYCTENLISYDEMKEYFDKL